MTICPQCKAYRREGEPHVCGDADDGYVPNVYLSMTEKVSLRCAVLDRIEKIDNRSYVGWSDPDFWRESDARERAEYVALYRRLGGQQDLSPESKEKVA